MDVFYALADPRRRKIIELLANNGQLSATQISDKFNVTAQAISQHLRVLLDAKLLLVQKSAQKRIYKLNTAEMLEMEEWTKHMTELWNKRFDRLDQLLETEKRKNVKRK
jgi:DNA-binding transcriptional ArsR family regulator